MITAASNPPEARGLARDGVRLLVATPDGLRHGTFSDLPRYVVPDDLSIVNTSATFAAAADGKRADGLPVTVDFSTPLDDGPWLVELRQTTAEHERVPDATADESIRLPGGMSVRLDYRYPEPDSDRLWAATVTAPGDVITTLASHGRPIRYSYVPDPWPLRAYQTVFSRDPGSAEMPSAGRPFSGELVARLISAGAVFAPITLHAGAASLECRQPPLPERVSVPAATAALINLAQNAGSRII